jgi:uncharacterized protein (TIGR03663 family)
MQKPIDTPRPIFFKQFSLRDWIVLIIIILAIFSRVIGLGDRVMSHDEVNHVVPAFDLFSGRGYRHDPVTHGPLQFHLMSLSYFIFGDNDFTSRLPHAIFGVLTVAFVMVFFRKYLGSIGAIVAGILFTISPFMLFYSRYARNDIICVFLGITAIYTFLRYYETREIKYLYLLTISLVLNFTAKETAYIFSAQLLLFAFLLFIHELISIKITNRSAAIKIFSLNILLIFIIILSLVISVLLFRQSYAGVQVNSAEFINTPGLQVGLSNFINSLWPVLRFILPGLIPLIFLITVAAYLVNKVRWDLFANSPAFSILILMGTLVLPLLAPFLVRFAGINPATYSDLYVVTTDFVFIAALFIISYIIGSAWDRENWWKLACVFYGIYFVLYSSFFTNPAGLMTGMIGSLGHWLDQHPVQRGGQPFYYYAFFLLPIYEFLASFGALLAFYFGIKKRAFWRSEDRQILDGKIDQQSEDEDEPNGNLQPIQLSQRILIPDPAINIFLMITSIIAYTIAGEKMPWLALHIVFPMILSAAWAINIAIEAFDRITLKNKRLKFWIFMGILLTTLLIIFQLLGSNPPFHSQTQFDLRATYRFVFLCLIETGLVIALLRQNRDDSRLPLVKFTVMGFLILLSVVTIRTSYRAAFINYDNAKEFLVYAHAADGPKKILEQVEEISNRTTNGLNIKVAYDNHGLYPFWWYLRHYPNRIVYLENPTRSLEEAPLIIAGQDKYAKLDPIVRDNYYYYEYMRLWWPMQDYWNLNWEKIAAVMTEGQMRQAIFEIWFNRDYSRYAQLKNNQNLTLETWLPSEKTRLYIRKDIAAEMWQYTNSDSFMQALETDPYADNLLSKIPDGFIGMAGSVPGELNTPRGMDIGPDGRIYIADSRNHRIQVFAPNGLLENVWGSFANVLEEDAPGGTFNEPWDVAVAPDGTVYVADTFNHRIQKFDNDGRFIKMWGVFAQGQDPESFWGPRGIDVDRKGNILVTDTGNKRIVVFDADLNYITQFGGGGYEPGQFDEPVGIAVSANDEVIVADTWNRRVQVFIPDEAGLLYTPVRSFDIEGWYGQGIDNKPYVTVDEEGNIYLTDPEAGRILQFSESGDFVMGYQDLNTTADLIGYPYGIAIDGDGKIWFSDASSNIIAFITLP